MIIDLILDRKDGVPYDASKFYSDVMGYESEGMSPDRSISKALDYGTNEDVQKALCNYVLWSANGDRYVAGVDPLSLEEILKTPVCQYINSVNWLENDEELEECSNGKNLNEGYLNMTTIPTMNTNCDNEWCLPEISAEDEFNCGIDCNVAPMVGAQGGQSLSTMAGGEQLPTEDYANLDYLLQMAGMDGVEATPEEVVATEVPEEEYTYQPVDDVFSIGYEPDFEDSCVNCDFDMDDADYNDILNNSRLEGEAPAISMENDFIPDEIEIPGESEVDMYDGIMNEPELEIEDTETEVPVEETSIETVEEPAVEEVSETNEANPEDMVLEKQPETDDTEAQQIKDYLVHNKEVLFGPASAKVEKYKKSLDGKSVEELRVEAEEVSPNWKKYIGKYKVNESVKIKKLNESLESRYAQYKVTDLETGAVKYFDSLEALNNFLKDDQGLVADDEFLSTQEDFDNFLKRNFGGVQLKIKPIWIEVEGNGNDLTIKQNTETKEYAVFRDNEILDDTITNDIESAEKVLENESETLQSEYEAEEINDRIADLSNYGIIHTEDLKELAKEVHVEPQELEDIALELGYKVEGILQEFDEDFDKLAGIETKHVKESKDDDLKYYIWTEQVDEEENTEFYGYFARHPEDYENRELSYFSNDFADCRFFDDSLEAEDIVERFENGSDLVWHIEVISTTDPSFPHKELNEEDSERLQGTKVEPTDIDLENDGVANVHVFNIQWDCDGADPKDLALPTEVDLTIAHDGSLDIADEIADQLSDDFGFCHYGFDFKVKSLGPDWDESTEDDIEDDVQEEVPAGQQILTEEGEELSDEDITEIETNETLDEKIGLPGQINKKICKSVPSKLKESEEQIEAKNVDIEPEEVKVEETTEADLKHEIPENDMIKDNVDTGEEVKFDEPIKAENGEIETKEFEVKETTEADLKHEIKDNEPIKDNIETGSEVKVDEPVKAENVDVKPEEKADKYVESVIYSVKLSDKIVECKSDKEFNKVLTENFNDVKSIVII